MDKFKQIIEDINDDFSEEQTKAVEEIKELKKRKEKKDEYNYTSFFETEDYLYEQINATDPTVATLATEGGVLFIKYNKNNDTWERVNEFEHKGKKYRPIVDEALLKGGVILPKGVKEYENTAEITNQLKEFFHKNIELPTFYETFLPNLVLFYWVYEKFPFIPYLQFVGRTATGKSTAMEVMGSICYKPIDTTGSLTIASMFRMATTWKGTLLIDEFDQVGENSKEITSFLKSGVSDRLVLRTEGDAKKEVKAYVVKAPKIFTSENPINDAGLQSRTMVVKMNKSTRKLPLFRLQHYYNEAQDIRSKLLLWRLRHFNKINLKDVEFGFEELMSFDRRVQQVITPIYYFSDENTKKEILQFAKDQEDETKRERRENIDGKIFEFIYENRERNLSLVQIAEYMNKGTRRETTERRIAAVIRTVLSLPIERVGHDNVRTVILDGLDEKISELALYYGLKEEDQLPDKGVAQVGSVANGSIETPTEQTVDEMFA